MARFDDERIPELLELIKRKPALFNFNHSSRKTEFGLRAQLWEEVAVDMCSNAAKCKDTWQFLRAVMRRERGTILKGGSASTWRWFTNMEYFEKHMPRFKNYQGPHGDGKGDLAAGVTKKELAGFSQSDASLPDGTLGASAPLPSRKRRPGYAAKSTSQPPRRFSAQVKRSPSVAEVHGINSLFPSAHNRHSVPARLSSTPLMAPPAPTNRSFATNFAMHAESPSHLMSPRPYLHSQPRSQSLTNGTRPSSVPSTAASLAEKDSVNSQEQEKTTLEDFTEYHFVSCLLEMLEDVPTSKRNLVKAKIMSELATAYQ